MRRAIHQGRVLELAPGFMVRYGQRVSELMGGAYPELLEQADVIDMWLAAEEQSFGRTLDQGTQTLAEEVERVRAVRRQGALGRGRVPPARHLRAARTT